MKPCDNLPKYQSSIPIIWESTTSTWPFFFNAQNASFSVHDQLSLNYYFIKIDAIIWQQTSTFISKDYTQEAVYLWKLLACPLNFCAQPRSFLRSENSMFASNSQYIVIIRWMWKNDGKLQQLNWIWSK